MKSRCVYEKWHYERWIYSVSPAASAAKVAAQRELSRRSSCIAIHVSGHASSRGGQNPCATVLRLPDFYGPGVEASLLHGAARAAVHGGTADMVGPIDRPHEFVFVPDVGPVVAKLLDTQPAFGEIWNFAGAGITTQRELVSEMERQTGTKLKLRVVGKTMLRLIGLFNKLMREMVEMNYLMTDPLIMDDTALQQLIGPIRKTPYAEGIRQMLAAVASKRTLAAAA